MLLLRARRGSFAPEASRRALDDARTAFERRPAFGEHDDDLIKVSVTRDRAKTKNLERDARATLSIVADNWSEYLVVEGTCVVHEENVLPELRRIYERVRGEPHPNW